MRADPLGQRLFARRPTPAPTPTPTPGTTLNPADKAAAITLSNGNLTATRDASADAHALARSIGKIPTADGNYYFERLPNISNGGMALCSSNWVLTNDPTDFAVGKACGVTNQNPANLYWSGGSNGMTPIGTSGNNYDGTHWFGMYIRRSGSGATVKLFVIGPAGWTTGGGDPNASGSGHDLSSVFGGIDIYAAAWMVHSGDTDLFNFGGSAYNYAASIGTVTNLA